MKKGLVIIFLLVCVLNVESQAGKIDELEERIELLETRVSELEKALGELLSEGPVSKVGRQISTPQGELWKNFSAWRKLRRGMSREEVIRLLGEAHSISVDAYAEYWRYGAVSEGGIARFSANGKLFSWDEPD